MAGEAALSPDGTVTGRISFDTRSLDTGHKQRDKHLRSADFFNAETHPQITVDITSVVRGGAVRAELTGTLTAAGITRPLRLTGAVTEESEQHITIAATGEFDRADFGMTWNRLGMVRGKATVTVVARFARER